MQGGGAPTASAVYDAYEHDTDELATQNDEEEWSSEDGIDKDPRLNPYRPIQPAFSDMNGSPPHPPPLSYNDLVVDTEHTRDSNAQQDREFDGSGSFRQYTANGSSSDTTPIRFNSTVRNGGGHHQDTEQETGRRIVSGNRHVITYGVEKEDVGRQEIQQFYHRTPEAEQQQTTAAHAQRSPDKDVKRRGRHVLDSRDDYDDEKWHVANGDELASKALEKAQRALQSYASRKNLNVEPTNDEDDVYQGLTNKIQEIQHRNREVQATTSKTIGSVPHEKDFYGDTRQESVNKAIQILYANTAPPPPPPPKNESGGSAPDTRAHSPAEAKSSFHSSTNSSRSKKKESGVSSRQKSPSSEKRANSKLPNPHGFSKKTHKAPQTKHKEEEAPSSNDWDQRIKELEASFQRQLEEQLRKQQTQLQIQFEQKLLEMEKQLLQIQRSKNKASSKQSQLPALSLNLHNLNEIVAPGEDASQATLKRLRHFYQQKLQAAVRETEGLRGKLQEVETERDNLKRSKSKSPNSNGGSVERGTHTRAHEYKSTDSLYKRQQPRKKAEANRTEISEKDKQIQELKKQIEQSKEKFNALEKEFHDKFISQCRSFETKIRGKASAAIATVRHTAEVAARHHYNQQLEKIEQQLREQGIHVESLPISLDPLPMPQELRTYTGSNFQQPTDPMLDDASYPGNDRRPSTGNHSDELREGFRLDSTKEGTLAEAAIPEIALGDSRTSDGCEAVKWTSHNNPRPDNRDYTVPSASSSRSYTSNASEISVPSIPTSSHMTRPQLSREDKAHLDKMLAADNLKKEQSEQMMQKIRQAREQTKKKNKRR